MPRFIRPPGRTLAPVDTLFPARKDQYGWPNLGTTRSNSQLSGILFHIFYGIIWVGSRKIIFKSNENEIIQTEKILHFHLGLEISPGIKQYANLSVMGGKNVLINVNWCIIAFYRGFHTSEPVSYLGHINWRFLTARGRAVELFFFAWWGPVFMERSCYGIAHGVEFYFRLWLFCVTLIRTGKLKLHSLVL